MLCHVNSDKNIYLVLRVYFERRAAHSIEGVKKLPVTAVDAYGAFSTGDVQMVPPYYVDTPLYCEISPVARPLLVIYCSTCHIISNAFRTITMNDVCV